MKDRRPQNSFRRWEPDEDDLIRELFHKPGGKETIAEETGRTMAAIRLRASNLGITHGPRKVRALKQTYAEPRPARQDLLQTLRCPGINGHGCGNRLWMERVPSAYGYIVPGAFDLICLAGHRFRL